MLRLNYAGADINRKETEIQIQPMLRLNKWKKYSVYLRRCGNSNTTNVKVKRQKQMTTNTSLTNSNTTNVKVKRM